MAGSAVYLFMTRNTFGRWVRYTREDYGIILQHDGAGWSRQSTVPLPRCGGVSTTGATSVWAAGSSSSHRLSHPGMVPGIQPKACTGSITTTMASMEGIVVHYDGISWKNQSLRATEALHGVSVVKSGRPRICPGAPKPVMRWWQNAPCALTSGGGRPGAIAGRKGIAGKPVKYHARSR